MYRCQAISALIRQSRSDYARLRGPSRFRGTGDFLEQGTMMLGCRFTTHRTSNQCSRRSVGSVVSAERGSVISALGDNFCKMYGVQRAFMANLERALADSGKKMVVLLVDLDNVPKFGQERSVDTIASLPHPVFVLGSANDGQAAQMASRGNFHFTLALKSKDAADAVICMVAASLQSLLVAHNRVGDVAVVTISDDRIFEQTAATLEQGGSPATTMSRSEAARGLFPTGLMAPLSRQQIAPTPSSEGDYGWACTCGKTFATATACDQHQADTGHSAYWACGQCKKAFSTERAWAQHQSSTGHGDCSCSCGRTFASQRSREQHFANAARHQQHHWM